MPSLEERIKQELGEEINVAPVKQVLEGSNVAVLEHVGVLMGDGFDSLFKETRAHIKQGNRDDANFGLMLMEGHLMRVRFYLNEVRSRLL